MTSSKNKPPATPTQDSKAPTASIQTTEKTATPKVVMADRVAMLLKDSVKPDHDEIYIEDTVIEALEKNPQPVTTSHTTIATSNAIANSQQKRPAVASQKTTRNNKEPQKVSPFILYAKLMRLDKPIGILLLLWPTLWSLWLAAKGMPRWDLLVIFTLGVILMRSAGCVINDFADRKIDGNVYRTQDRPLVTGAVSSAEALVLFAVLCLIAFGLVLLTDPLTIKLSLVGLALAFIYPFMKRHTHLPQIVLGAAFAWSIPMAFAAQAGKLTQDVGMLYLAVVLWTVVYDTFYAMVDRDDDIKIGVKSTAILFGEQDRIITGALQIMTLLALLLVGQRFGLGLYYYVSLILVAALFTYQQLLIRDYRPGNCFKAFLNNNWVGAAVFAGIAADAALK